MSQDIECTIKEASELLDVPTTTLRYWEKLGLIQSNRQEGSNYRTYSMGALFEAGNISFYRQMGIPIKQLETIRAQSLQDMVSAFGQTAQELREEIARTQGSLWRLEYQRALSQYTIDLLKSDIHEETPAVARLSIYDPETPWQRKMLVRNMQRYALYVDADHPDKVVEVYAEYPALLEDSLDRTGAGAAGAAAGADRTAEATEGGKDSGAGETSGTAEASAASTKGKLRGIDGLFGVTADDAEASAASADTAADTADASSAPHAEALPHDTTSTVRGNNQLPPIPNPGKHSPASFTKVTTLFWQHASELGIEPLPAEAVAARSSQDGQLWDRQIEQARGVQFLEGIATSQHNKGQTIQVADLFEAARKKGFEPLYAIANLLISADMDGRKDFYRVWIGVKKPGQKLLEISEVASQADAQAQSDAQAQTDSQQTDAKTTEHSSQAEAQVEPQQIKSAKAAKGESDIAGAADTMDITDATADSLQDSLKQAAAKDSPKSSKESKDKDKSKVDKDDKSDKSDKKSDKDSDKESKASKESKDSKDNKDKSNKDSKASKESKKDKKKKKKKK